MVELGDGDQALMHVAGPFCERGPASIEDECPVLLQRILNDFMEDQAFLRPYDLAPLPSVSSTGDTQEV